MLYDPPRSVTPGVNSFRKMSLANDFCFDIDPGSELILRKIIRSPCMSLTALRFAETCLNNLRDAL